MKKPFIIANVQGPRAGIQNPPFAKVGVLHHLRSWPPDPFHHSSGSSAVFDNATYLVNGRPLTVDDGRDRLFHLQ